MNYSQKIARAFEIADYILLIPAGFGVFAASMFIKDALWFALIIYAIAAFGCVLLAGYFKHSRGRLDANRVRALWIATGVYNGILLLPALVMMWFSARDSVSGYGMNSSLPSLLIPFAVVFGYLTTIFLSIKAYRFEKNNQKYL